MRVFICYAREDGNEVASRLYQHLSELGAEPWMDVVSIPAGASWNRSIDAAIAACEAFVVVLTRAAVESDDVEGEYLMALDEGKYVIPFVADDVFVPRKLRGRQWVDARADAEDAAYRLAAGLGLVGAEPPGVGAPALAASPLALAVEALGRLARLEVEAVVFDAADNTNTYVQFGWPSEGIAPYEAVSDQFHERPEPLTEDQRSILVDRGFGEEDNWRQWVELGDEANLEALAQHALETLAVVYGVDEADVRIVFVGGSEG